MATNDDELVETMKRDFRKASVDDKTKHMLEFVERVTLRAHEIEEGEVQNLRSHGFSDEDIFDIVHITGYFNHINRLADALGVDLEDFMIQGRETTRSGI